MAADITGKKGSNFTFTIDSGSVSSAYLEVPNQPIVALTIANNSREITVPNLPAGQSLVRLDIVWAPGDSNAVIDVGTVMSGSATAASPKHTIDDGESPGYVELLGQ